MATRPIDEKIVAMKMDNSDFIKKASETTKSMSGLTSFLNKIPGINLGKTTSELQNINKSVNGIETSRLSSALDAVTSKFSALGIIGTTALVNITSKAVDAGLSIARNLTVKPVLDGFREYELKIGSIQTILANTQKDGTSLADVTSALDQLNKYADKTIYSFSQMTKNVGLFTNAGLGLKESVSDLKGFSNAAAASGTSAEDMARAAFQLSQGMASGFIITQDWMSLSNAGMGNNNMKTDLINMGHAMGTLDKSTEHTLKNWKASLTDDKWLTKEVFSKYLQAMAGDLDEAQLRTVGLTKAQATLLLQNAKTGEDAATKVRTFTQMMGTIAESIGSGWADSWEIIFGDFDHATKLWSGFTELISAPFNNLTKSRNDFLKGLKDAGVFQDIFVGIGAAIYLVGNALGAVTKGFDKGFGANKVAIVVSLVQGFKNLLSAMTPSQETLAKISLIFQAIGSTVRVVVKIISELAKVLFKLIPDNLGISILNILAGFAKMVIAFNEGILNGNGITKTFEGLGKVLSWLGDRIGNIIDGFSKLSGSIFEFFTTMGKGGNETNSVFSKDSKIVTWGIAIGNASKSVVESISKIKWSLAPISEGIQSFFSAIGTGFNWLKKILSGIGNIIKDNMPSGKQLFAGGFVAALVTISGIVLKRVNDISKIFGGFGKVIDAFAGNLESVSSVLNGFSLSLKADALLTAAFAVGVLAVSIMLLSRVDGAKAATAVGAIVGSLTAVVAAMGTMSKLKVTGGIGMAASIIGVAVALSIMSIALKQFGSMNPDELTKGLIGVATVMASIAGAFALMNQKNDKKSAATAVQIVAMSIAVLIIVNAVKEMGSMNLPDLAKGIGGLVAIIGALSGAFILMGKFSGKGASASALQFIAIATSVVILVEAIKMISGIKPSDLIIGLGTITLILGAVAAFAKLTSGKGLMESAAGLLAISIALNLIIIPILALGSMSLETLGKGLLGMTLALLAIAAAAEFMTGTIAGAAAMTVMAIALNLLLIPILAFAAMGWGPMLTGIAGIGIALAVLAGVSLLLAPAVVPLLGFGAAIALMGIAMLAAGAGMSLFGAGLVALAGLSGAAIATIIATLGALIVGLLSLIPSAVKFVADLIIAIATTIRDKAPEILAIIADTLLRILDKVAEYIPKIVKAFVKIYTALIDSVAKEGPKLIQSLVNLVITLVETLAKTVDENGPRFVNAFLSLFGSIVTLVVQAGLSIIKSLIGWIPGVDGALDKVSKKAEQGIKDYFDAAKIADDKGVEFADGLASKAPDAKNAGIMLAKSANDGLKTADGTASGVDFGKKFGWGIMSKGFDVNNAAKNLAQAAVDGTNETLKTHSPGLVGEESGSDHGDGVVVGLNKSKDKVENASKNMSSGVLSGMNGIPDMIRDKLFLKDADVKKNEKQVKEVEKQYDDSDKKKKKSAKELDAAFVKSRDAIEERKFFMKITLDEELAAWKKIQKQYKVGSEERKQADREVFTVEQAILKKKEEAYKNTFNNIKKGIEEEKTFKVTSLTKELNDWQWVQKQYKVGTDERKEADKEVLRVKREISDKLTSINDEYAQNVRETNRNLIDQEKQLNDDYKRTYDERVSSLTNFVGLFDQVKSQDSENPVTGTKLLENLRGQVNAVATWSDDLQRLGQKGIDDGLLKELENMGPSAAIEIAALNNLTSSQLDQYVELWKKKSSLATSQASKELEPLREDTNKAIEQLRKDASKKLDEYKDEWTKKITEIRTGATDGFIGLTTDMKTIGANVIAGLTKGLGESTEPLYAKVQEIAKGIEDTIKKTLKIKSPSQVMMGIGRFAGQGLAIGLSSTSDIVGEKSKSLALSARDSINKFLSKFQVQDFDNQIMFKAVLDDSEITKSALNLSNTNIPIQLGTTNGLILSAKADLRQNGDKTTRTDAKQKPANNDPSGQNSNRPIIIQSILNGRVIAEETYNDISQLIGGSANLGYVMKGV